jgi:hypothetical protein
VPRHTVAIGVLGGGDVDLGEAELAAPEVMITKVSVIGGVSVRESRKKRNRDGDS